MALLIVELGRWEIEDEARREFSDDDVEVIRRKGDIDVATMSRGLAVEFFERLKALKLRSAGPIRLVLSGPVAVNFLLGMFTGLNHFDVEIFQYNANLPAGQRYVSCGRPTHGWLSGPADAP